VSSAGFSLSCHPPHTHTHTQREREREREREEGERRGVERTLLELSLTRVVLISFARALPERKAGVIMYG